MKKILICVTVLLLMLGYSEKSFSQKVYDYVSVEKQPEYPGGMNKFYQYLGEERKKSKEEFNGKVFLSFIVDKDGSLKKIRVVKGAGEKENKEAIRLLKNSPKWSPGVYKDKAVAVKYNLPVNFKKV